MAGERKKARARYFVTGPGQLKGFPWGLVALSDSLGPLDACEVVEAVERSETDEGNLSLLQSLSCFPQFPSSVSPSGCHLPPRGRLRACANTLICQAQVSGRAALKGPHVAQTHSCFSPYQRAAGLLLKGESAYRSPFPEIEKKCPPDLRTSRRAVRQ